MMDELAISVVGLVPFLMHFVPAVLIVLVFMRIYSWVTPHDEAALIRENNAAAAIAFLGALLGFTFPLASAMANSDGLIDFVVWAVIAGAAQLITFLVFRAFFPRISERVTNGEVAAAVNLAGWSVMVGTINAAAMTY